jgi:hypothetical protein
VFSARRNRVPPAERDVDISFCGTLHSNRARRLAQLLKVARRERLKLSLLLYFHSRWLLLIKSLFHSSNARFLTRVATAGFSKRQIFELFTRSKFVFDLPHPGQRGLTTRTFERGGGQMKRVLLTGATGFVGRPLCAILSEAGYEVRAATRTANISVPGAAQNERMPGRIHRRISRDRRTLMERPNGWQRGQ